MTFPAISNVATYAHTVSNISTFNVTLPANISAGNLLLMVVGVPNAGALTDTGGFTAISNYGGCALLAKVATGAEGSTVSLTSAGIGKLCAVSYRITGWGGSLSDVVTSSNSGSSGTVPNPPSNNMSVAKDYLWLAPMVKQFVLTVSAYPSGYSNGYAIDNSATMTAAMCSLTNNASSEDPSAYTTSSSSGDWQAFTVAVKPYEPNTAKGLFFGSNF